ncbi:MAG: sensor histidine kinase [Micromonosporaceae bacterium]|nr:sensor histidine kinase [Micromonosporaceae bacterium]
MNGGTRTYGGWSWRTALVDGLLGLVIMVLGTGNAVGAEAWAPDRTPIDGFGVALIAVAALPLAVRRRWPAVTLGVTTVATSLYLMLGYPFGVMLVAVAVATYTVAARLPLRTGAAVAGAALLVLLLHLVIPLGGGEPFDDPFGVLPGAAWIVVPFAIGTMVRGAREVAARARAEQVRQVADQERLRVAQEVHDVVGHGLAAINMQAEIALHLLPSRPEQAEPALTTISRTSKQALDELRATLNVVRQDDRRTPEAGLSRLADLVGRMSGTGVAVTVRVTGVRRDLPVAVDLAAYRVVQESLTNVLRHAGGGSAVTVRLGYLPEALEVEVTDTGPEARPADPDRDAGRDAEPGGDPGRLVATTSSAAATAAAATAAAAAAAAAPGSGSGGGHGIAGMRARVAALGGRFEAGRSTGGGFRVYAWLPEERA